MRVAAYIRYLVQQLGVGLMVCGVVPMTLFFWLAKTETNSLSPRDKLLAALKTWRGCMLLAINIGVFVLAAFAGAAARHP